VEAIVVSRSERARYEATGHLIGAGAVHRVRRWLREACWCFNTRRSCPLCAYVHVPASGRQVEVGLWFFPQLFQPQLEVEQLFRVKHNCVGDAAAVLGGQHNAEAVEQRK
jgi:hypothetical protein